MLDLQVTSFTYKCPATAIRAEQSVRGVIEATGQTVKAEVFRRSVIEKGRKRVDASQAFLSFC